ncbi:MAG: orotate phosphoribosyltransferase [Thermoproteota archaeon]|nr:MAG: orotate phosphoribosyltransferase [Candidatus Korarchaeota archaeon]
MEAALVGEVLKSAGCILFGKFKLTSGRESSYYIDLGTLPSHPVEFDLIASLAAWKIKKIGLADYIAGIPVRGVPLASLVAYKLKVPFLQVRKERKMHGTMKAIEGEFKPGGHVVVMDDVATTGGSLAEAVRRVREERLVVDYCFVVVDREEGAQEKLSELGAKLYSLCRVSDIIR